MTEFTTKVDLLHNSIYIKELKVKHFKILLKTLLGDEPDYSEVLTNLTNILTEVTSYSIEQLYNLSIIDFLLIILHLRSISIGNSIQLELLNEKNVSINLNIDKVIQTLLDTFSYNYTQVIDDIEIEYQIISIHNFLLSKQDTNDLLFLKKYIKTLTINKNDSIKVNELKDEIFLKIINALPAKNSFTILKYAKYIIQQLNQTNLLQHIIERDLSLYLDQETFIFILQLLFSKNLLPLYENIFALSKFANMSPLYIEECTPGEYTVFVKLLEQILKEQNRQIQTNNSLPPINPNEPDFP
jgi:hypothetical protein